MPRIDDKRLQELADKTIFARTNEFNDYVLRTIGRRIKATGRASAADQTALNNMKNISGDMAKIKKKLAETMELNVADVEAILTQTVTEGVNSYKPLFDFKGAEFIPFEQNEYAKFLVNHWAQETCEKMINLSRTKALCFDKYNALGEVIGTTPLEGAFQQAIDEAVMAVSTGTTDFNTAMKKTVERLGGSGVRVDYGNNITRGLPGMVRSNLLYGAKQAAQAYDEYIGEQIGCNGFEVDYHPGPRLTHAFMGGVMYSYNGDVVIDGVKYEDGSEALERLKDHGCLHFKMGVILGVSEPRYDKDWLEQQKKKDTELIEYNGKQKTMYQWKQGARRLETAVREQRDIAYMAKESGIKSLENQAKGKIADYRTAYDDLCDKVGIEKRYDRMATFPSQRAKAIAERGISGKSVLNTKENVVDMKYINSKEYRSKFANITENPKVNDAIYNYSKAIVTHRQGTYYEDIYLVDKDTGNLIAKETKSKAENTIFYSAETEKIIRENPNSLISIHNHGTNNPPTGSDLCSAGSHRYSMGVIACHNGDVYTYKVSDKPILAETFDKTVDKYRKQGYNEIESIGMALDSYKKSHNIEWRKY